MRKQLRNGVREARNRHGLSQRALAEKTGLARQTIVVLERDGGYRPTSDVMVRLSEVLEMDLGSLFWTEAAEAEKVPA